MTVEAEPNWWLGVFVGNIREALKESPADARARLKDTLARFVDSPACTDECRAALRVKPRKPEAALNDGYTLERDYKPCGNPECRSPILRSSRREFCDAGCRKAARAYAREQGFRAEHPDYDSIPF